MWITNKIPPRARLGCAMDQLMCARRSLETVAIVATRLLIRGGERRIFHVLDGRTLLELLHQVPRLLLLALGQQLLSNRLAHVLEGFGRRGFTVGELD